MSLSEAQKTENGRRKSKLLTVTPSILGIEFAERVTYFGLLAIMVTYLKHLGAGSSTAASTAAAFSGACYFFPPLAGYLADAHFGRYKTVLGFSLIAFLGMLILTASAAIPGIKVKEGNDADSFRWTLLFISFFLTSLGIGGIKPNSAPFGADQFDDLDEKDREEKKSFFNWYYCLSNTGAFIGPTVIVYLNDRGYTSLALGIPVFIIAVAVLFFMLRKSVYVFEVPAESPLARFFKITFAAIRNRYRALQESHEQKKHWLDWAVGPVFDEKAVYDVKLVYGVLPIFYTTIIFWLGSAQLWSAFVLQGAQLERVLHISGSEIRIPAGAMLSFSIIGMVCTIPVYNLILLPTMKRVFDFTPTILQRSGTGYFVAFLSLLSSAMIEKRRLSLYRNGAFHVIELEDGPVEVVDLGIQWQIIPYGLMGIAEGLASIGLTEFFYSQAPETMKSTMVSLRMLAVCLGGFISSLCIHCIEKISYNAGNQWVPDNLNEGHLDYYLFLFAGVALLVTIWFVLVSRTYTYRRVYHDQELLEFDRDDVCEQEHSVDNSLALEV